MKLVLATRNAGKIGEQELALAGCSVELIGLDRWPGLPPPEEPGPGFLENAVAKALYYHRATGLPAVGEDSGLEVDALGGEPGVLSARWLGKQAPYAVKNARLLERLSGLSGEQRRARFVSAVALAAGGEVVFRVVESCEGRIAEQPRGTGGFGYDPVFFCPLIGKTLAEATPEEKNRVSHRGKAMARLRDYLDQRGARA
ncbi:MAG: non-canonical purine NTP pyrophosphatase [Acidobacteriota bacterium]